MLAKSFGLIEKNKRVLFDIAKTLELKTYKAYCRQFCPKSLLLSYNQDRYWPPLCELKNENEEPINTRDSFFKFNLFFLLAIWNHSSMDLCIRQP